MSIDAEIRSERTSRSDFAALYRANVAAVMGFFARRGVDPQTVFDLSSETFAEAIASFQTEAEIEPVAWDAPPGESFRRELPFSAIAGGDPPRLRDARRLVEAGVLTLTDPDHATVTTPNGHRTASLNPPSCTCRWWQEHPGDRGPCEHILALFLSSRAETSGQVAPPGVTESSMLYTSGRVSCLGAQFGAPAFTQTQHFRRGPPRRARRLLPAESGRKLHPGDSPIRVQTDAPAAAS